MAPSFAKLLVLLPALAFAAPTAEPAVPIGGSSDIVGGSKATSGQFPYQVALTKSGSLFCGGVLLNANTVLTAAHCSVGQSASSVKVRAGTLTWASGGTQVGVSSIVVNPGYNANTVDNDIAIWKLSTSLPASSTIGYATLPASGADPAAGSTVTTAGWGLTSEGGSTLPSTLNYVSVPVISRATCNTDYGAGSITSQMFCAGLTAGGKDSCNGDSGGPIVDASKVLQGTVSWGQGCAEAGFPGVYSRIGAASMLSFIKAHL